MPIMSVVMAREETMSTDPPPPISIAGPMTWSGLAPIKNSQQHPPIVSANPNTIVICKFGKY